MKSILWKIRIHRLPVPNIGLLVAVAYIVISASLSASGVSARITDTEWIIAYIASSTETPDYPDIYLLDTGSKRINTLTANRTGIDYNELAW